MEFDGFEALGKHFLGAAHRMGPAVVKELQVQGATIEAAAKAKFGTYGPGWQELAASTMAERERLGYTPDDPLFRSGGLQGTVTHKVGGEGLFVGVEPGTPLTDWKGRTVDAAMVMAAQEFGTEHIPPRPVFGQVVNELENQAHAFGLGVAVRAGL